MKSLFCDASVQMIIYISDKLAWALLQCKEQPGYKLLKWLRPIAVLAEVLPYKTLKETPSLSIRPGTRSLWPVQHHRHLPAIKLVYPATAKRDAEHGTADATEMIQSALSIVTIHTMTGAGWSHSPSAQRYSLCRKNYVRYWGMTKGVRVLVSRLKHQCL